MPLIITKPQFQTSDGLLFDNEADAARHEALTTATKAFERAREELNRALAATLKTADGYPFNLGYLSYYYYVSLFGEIKYVGFSYTDTTIQTDGANYYILRAKYESQNYHTASYNPERLFKMEDAARRAQLPYLEEKAANLAREISLLRTKLGIEPC